MFKTVGDIVCDATFKGFNAKVLIDDTHNYVFVVSDVKRVAYKVTNTSNKGVVILSWPMSWARVKLIAPYCKSVYRAGNVRLRAGSKPTTRVDSVNEWLEGVA